jgi:hypothetical protein
MQADELRTLLLAIASGAGTAAQEPPVLRDIRSATRGRDPSVTDRQILEAWHELFRTGVLVPGIDLNNPHLPFFHVSERGRRSATELSRDPANPIGYMAFLKQRANIDESTESYISEALRAFNAECVRAAAVMVGCGAECLLLTLRDDMAKRYSSKGGSPPKALMDWKWKTVSDALYQELTANKSSLDRQLWDKLEAYWPAMIGQIRIARNDSGHPGAVSAVTLETVHSNLLMFPAVAELIASLREWVMK